MSKTGYAQVVDTISSTTPDSMPLQHQIPRRGKTFAMAVQRPARQPAIAGILNFLGWFDVVLTVGAILYILVQLSKLPYGYEPSFETYGLMVALAVAGITSAAVLFGFATLLSLTATMKAALLDLSEARR